MSLNGAAARFALIALVLTSATPALAYLLVGAHPAALLLATLTFLALSALALAYLVHREPVVQLGACNLATLVRLLITSALVAPLVAPGTTGFIVGLALAAFALDGIDGWLARRLQQASVFGARFDMEVDAVFGLVLALNAWAAGTIGPAVLLLGLPRYVFAAAAYPWPWINRPLPNRFGRKLVCVLQIALLIALQLPVLAGGPAALLVTLGSAALAWSFGRDLRWLWSSRT